MNAILRAVVDPGMAKGDLDKPPDILRDIKPGNRLRLVLVGYTDELDHTFAMLETHEGRATVRVAHVAGVVEVKR